MKMSKSFSLLPRLISAVFISTLLTHTDGLAVEKLILIGGGARPAAALQQLSDWSNQEQGRILIITWASTIPKEVTSRLVRELLPHFRGQLDVSLKAPETTFEREIFLKKLAAADGIFFSGGDQNRIIEAFKGDEGLALKKALKEAYKSGKAFAGTSAGTAIMSHHMIMGPSQNGVVPLAEGLGLLPADIIVDQHFSQRERASRLLEGKSQTGARLAIGIDEDTAFILTNQKQVRIAGEHTVRLFKDTNSMNEESILPNQHTMSLPSLVLKCRQAHVN